MVSSEPNPPDTPQHDAAGWDTQHALSGAFCRCGPVLFQSLQHQMKRKRKGIPLSTMQSLPIQPVTEMVKRL